MCLHERGRATRRVEQVRLTMARKRKIQPVMTALYFDHLSLCDLSAYDVVEVAGQLSCTGVSLFVRPLPLGPYRDLVTDQAARREVVAALRDYDLSVGVVEPFLLDEHPDWDAMERTAALAAELGGDINALAMDMDAGRRRDAMGRLADLARAAGTRLVIEPFSLSPVRTPADGLALAEMCGDDVGLTVDTLHVMRTGGSWADVAALPPERIIHVQISDGTREAPADLASEAVQGRLPPGLGSFALEGLLPLLPGHVRIAVEAPFCAPPGTSPLERGRILVDAMRRLQASVAL